MSNTIATHEPIKLLDAVLNEEERRSCEYSHQWRNYTISRSGRFKSKNQKKRDTVDRKLFDCNSTHSKETISTHRSFSSNHHNEMEKVASSQLRCCLIGPTHSQNGYQNNNTGPKERDKQESYSYYETNL